MANVLLTPKIYVNTMLALLKNQLVMGKLVDTELKDIQVSEKTGATVYVKRPPEFVLRSGAQANVQNVIQGDAPVTINNQSGVDVKFTDLELVTSLDALGKSSVMKSAAATMAQGIDAAIMAKVLEFPSWVGTPGQTINSVSDFFQAPQRLDELAVPQDSRNAVLAPTDYWAQAGAMTALYQYNGDVANDALKKARLPIQGNVDAYQSQNVPNLVMGTRAASGASQVDGANQNVAYTSVNSGLNAYTQQLNIKGLTSGHTIKAGEVFSIAGVYAVNPRSKAAQTFNAQFVVLEDATADGAGKATLRIANPIIIDGAYQTVDAAPLDSANITWMGTASTGYRQNAVFHKSAIKLVFARPVMPSTGVAAYATDPTSGITIRYWQFSDGLTDEHYHRWDYIIGVANTDRRLGTRVSGTP
ncbi:P22 phage major capsid protein family protein [Rhizorhabdus wittichii]|uniref:P22 phage major capsid protein family protein n=1 Tax=Rhizorhabdus wittichii TaxID=160791 RepID=UPI000310715F|nr:P22 phage major capsid protein family protein [Rhizorhabdus wittichii]